MKFCLEALLVAAAILMAAIPGAYCIEFRGGTSVITNGPSSAQGNLVSNGNGAIGYGVASGDTSLNVNHWVKDTTGKLAEVYINVIRAATLGYSYSLTPNSDHRIVPSRTSVSAQESITVTHASSIDAYALAANNPRQSQKAKAEIKVNGGKTNDANLDTYTNSATATASNIQATQTVGSASGDGITIDTSGAYGSYSSEIQTDITGLPNVGALFEGSSQSTDGPSTSVSQNGHIAGSFTSTAKSGKIKDTRTSNYGTEYDLNMLASMGSSGPSVSGVVGYYVDPSMATSTVGAIQGAVNAAQSGDAINAAAGTYTDNVVLNKALGLVGLGSGATTTSFTLNNGASVLSNSHGLTALTVNVNNGAKIQDGVTLASSGGTINVGPGTYYENVVLGKSLTLNGAGQGTTAVNGNQVGSVFVINPDVSATLSGMTITNGKASNGGGIYNEGTLDLNNVLIGANTASDGGGIYNTGTVTMNSGSTITSNTATNGGGIENVGTVYMNSGSTITSNTASIGGGGIDNAGTVIMTGGLITGNKAHWGGGIDNYNLGIVTMNSGSTIAANSATNGGGIYNYDLGTVTMTGGSITSNTAYWGGGIESAGTVTMNSGSTIAANSATNGGGICNDYLGAVTMNSGSTIAANSATNGGGICNDYLGTVTMNSGSTIAANSATNGGGIYDEGGTVYMNSGSLIVSNVASNYGGGIYMIDGSTLNMAGSSSITRNTAEATAPAGGGIYDDNTGTAPNTLNTAAGFITGNSPDDVVHKP
jgi:hypothetical protein